MRKLKSILKVLFILVLGLTVNLGMAQTETEDVKVKKKEKKITISKVKLVNGEKIKWDTTLFITKENKEEVEKYLKENADLNAEINFELEFFDDDMKLKLHELREHKIHVYELQEQHKDQLHKLKELHKYGDGFVYLTTDGDSSTVKIDLDFDMDHDFDVDVHKDAENHMIWVSTDGKHKEGMKHMEFIRKGDKKGNVMFFGDDDSDVNFSFTMDTKELNEDDLAILKAAGIKMKSKNLAVKRIRLTYEDDNFELIFKLKTEGKATVKVVDSEGKVVFNDKVQYFPGTYHKSIGLNNESEGYYYIYIEQASANFSTKIHLN